MQFEGKKPAHLVAGVASLFAVSAGLLVLILPGGREAIDYLIAGTFATAIALVAAFLLFARRGGPSTQRRRGLAE
jgi:hypothetical protein